MIALRGFLTNRSPAGPRSCGALSGTSKPVSRVLSFKTAIYLAAPLPTRSSHPLNAAGQAYCVPTVLLRIEFTAMRRSRTSGGLLPPPFHPYLDPIWSRGGISLLHFSWGRPRRVLPVIPCPLEPGLSSRTGLSPRPRGCPVCLPNYHSGKSFRCQRVFIEFQRTI